MNPNYYQGDLKTLFTDHIPLIDVRAPVEFNEGAFPNAVNLPILDDGQRHEVGICYKEKGQQEAIELGHRLVSGSDRKSKIDRWLKEIEKNPDALICCFRGGMRSQIAQSWLSEEGIEIPIIEGGYKRLRTYLLSNLELQADGNSFLVISGNTGSGKTRILEKLSAAGCKAIDLEGLANHRGSAFGQNSTPQPSQIDFENALSIQFMEEEGKGSSYMLIEDESPTIGRITVPRIIYEKKVQSDIFVLRIPIEERADLILKDYVEAMWPTFKELEEPYGPFFDFYKLSFDRIKKRLGGAIYQECIADLKGAVDWLQEKGSFSRHKVWINKLLVHYYDPLYEKGLAKKREFVVGEGGEAQLMELLKRGEESHQKGEALEERGAKPLNLATAPV